MDISDLPPYLLIVFAFAGGLFCVAMATWVIRSVTRAAKAGRTSLQFTIADFLCLFVLLQVPMALIHAAPIEWGFKLVADAWAWSVVVLAWIHCVRLMSRAGFSRSAQRATFLLFVFPVFFLAVITLVVASLLLLVGLINGNAGTIIISIPLLACAALALPLARRIMSRMMENARAAMPSADEAADNAAAREE